MAPSKLIRAHPLEQKSVAQLCLMMTACAAIAFCLSSAHGASPPNGAARLLAEFDIPKNGDHIVVPVQIGERAWRFAVDTGSLGCVYDNALRPYLGTSLKKDVAETVTGKAPAEMFAHGARLALLGNIDVTPQMAVFCTDLHVDRHGVDPLDGLLGTDAFHNKVLTIDFDAGKLRFFDRAPAHAGRPIPLVWDSDENGRTDGPFIYVDLPQVGRRRFLVDTGGCDLGAGSLSKPLFDRMVSQGVLRVTGSSYVWAPAVRGTKLTAEGRVPWISVSGLTHRDLIFSKDDELNVSTLGLGYLSRYVVTFDFQKSVMYLLEGKQFARAEQENHSGLWFGKGDGKIIVTRVFQNTPAARAGIQTGDGVMSVDGLVARRGSVFEFSRLVSRGLDVKVLVIRRGQQREVLLRLARARHNPVHRPRAQGLGD